MTQTKKFERNWLFLFEKIDIKLIFGKYTSLDLYNCCKLKIALAPSKDDQNKEENGKAKVQQL